MQQRRQPPVIHLQPGAVERLADQTAVAQRNAQLVCEAFDSAWLQVNHRRLPALLHGLFLALLVLNLVAGFQVLGTLMAVGVMIITPTAISVPST